MSTNSNRPINELMGITMEKIKEMVDINPIIGDPITLEDGTTVIPISKVSYGFASGGSDLPTKSEKSLFGGGAGAGVSIKPEGFLVISNGNAKMVPVSGGNDPVSSALNAIPDVVSKVSGMIKKKKDASEEDGIVVEEE